MENQRSAVVVSICPTVEFEFKCFRRDFSDRSVSWNIDGAVVYGSVQPNGFFSKIRD